jgi:hypothetical protein
LCAGSVQGTGVYIRDKKVVGVFCAFFVRHWRSRGVNRVHLGQFGTEKEAVSSTRHCKVWVYWPVRVGDGHT